MERGLTLEQVDVDGAIRESAEQAAAGLESGDTRLDFLKKSALGGGAVVGGGALLSAFVPGVALGSGFDKTHRGHTRPPSSFGKGDVGILNYALTLEFLERAFYTGAMDHQRNTGFVGNGQLAKFLHAVYRDERAHVKVLRSVLGSKAVKKPRFDFQGTNKDASVFAATSFALENEGVHAYLGQVPNIKAGGYLNAAASIVTIEARHAAVIGLIVKESVAGIAPAGPFDVPRGANRVLKDVAKLHFIK
jgi:hypothetical protein